MSRADAVKPVVEKFGPSRFRGRQGCAGAGQNSSAAPGPGNSATEQVETAGERGLLARAGVRRNR